jgi:hypothetical protein
LAGNPEGGEKFLLETKKASGIRVLGGLLSKYFYFRASSNLAAVPQAHIGHGRGAVTLVHAILLQR